MELMQQLHRLQQKDLSIEQYRQNMELLMLRAEIKEESRLIITCFQSGLHFDIRDKVELLPYNDFNNLVQLCIRVKDQIKRKSSFKKIIL